MQDIRFSGTNGDCPYFKYDDYKFFISDGKVGNEWKYSFYMKDTKSDHLTFEDVKKAKEYVLSINRVRFVCTYGDLSMYETMHKEYVISGKKVTIKNKPEIIAIEFDKYVDCLKFAKKYVTEFIKKRERQISIF